MTVEVCSKCDFFIFPAASSEHAAAIVSCKPTKCIKRKMLARSQIALSFAGSRYTSRSRSPSRLTVRDGLSQQHVASAAP